MLSDRCVPSLCRRHLLSICCECRKFLISPKGSISQNLHRIIRINVGDVQGHLGTIEDHQLPCREIGVKHGLESDSPWCLVLNAPLTARSEQVVRSPSPSSASLCITILFVIVMMLASTCVF